MKNYRQGEIVILSLGKDEKIPENAENKGDRVIREGEMTGHLHELASGTLYNDKYNPEGILWLEAQMDTILTHPEHDAIKLPKGNYKIVIQREYQENGDTFVRD